MIKITHRKTKEVLIIFRVNVLFTLLSGPLQYFPLDLWLQLKLIYDLDNIFQPFNDNNNSGTQTGTGPSQTRSSWRGCQVQSS